MPNKRTRVPSVLLLNARSIVTHGKIDDLSLSCSSVNPDFCVVTETWLNKSHDSSYFQIPNYYLSRMDRVDRSGGGVAVWAKDGISSSVLSNHDFPTFVECLCLSFRLGNNSYLLCGVYYPPNLGANASSMFLDALVSVVDRWSSNNLDGEVIVAGDLNDFDVDSLCRNLDLVKKVTSPTRGDSILDHCLVSSGLELSYPDATVGPPLSTSRRGSHGQVLLQPYNPQFNSPQNRFYTVLDLRKPYVDAFLAMLSSSSFHEVYKLADIDTKVAAFYDILNSCLGCIPRTSIYMTSRDKPWMSPHLKHLVNLRWKAYRSRDFTEYNRLKCAIREGIKHAKQNWIARSSSSANKLWKTVKEFSGKGKGRPLDPILSNFDDLPSALNHLNNKFCEVFDPKREARLPNDNSDWSPLVDVSDVDKFLSSLNLNKSTGSDGITNFIYKSASSFLSEPLCHIINSSILQRRVPSAFKCCDVSPIPKNYPVSVDQLRPISLLSIPSKLLEHCILKSSRQIFLRCIPSHQFAYKPMSNTTCALITLHDATTKILDEDETVGVIMISYDFSKAFDTVAHHLLIEKLVSLDFPPGFVLWLHDYLSDRLQRVRIGNVRSKSLPVTSGVPQGSLLGPYLFLMMSYDFISSDPSHVVCQYADDTTVACRIRSLSDLDSIVNKEMSHMCRWSASNGFRLNVSKTQCLFIRKRTCIYPTPGPNLQLKDSIKLLGVIWSSSLSWDLHFKSMELKCVRRLYLLRLLKNVVSHDELWRVFDAVIANALLYAVELFGPLSFASQSIVHRIFKRVKALICGNICNCSKQISFDSMQASRTLKLLSKAQSPLHPLHSIVQHPNYRGRFFVPFSRTSRRRKCFTVFSILLQTGVHTD